MHQLHGSLLILFETSIHGIAQLLQSFACPLQADFVELVKIDEFLHSWMQSAQALPTLFQLGLGGLFVCLLLPFLLSFCRKLGLFGFAELALLFLFCTLHSISLLLTPCHFSCTRSLLGFFLCQDARIVLLSHGCQCVDSVLLGLGILLCNAGVLTHHPSLLLSALSLFQVIKFFSFGLCHGNRVTPRLEAVPEIVEFCDLCHWSLRSANVRNWLFG
mmetsp:Transcript_82735/g.146075  ORF Transcript_82735/g.146075 Transcript_82735/m.146075 type:complete len:217 (-) Transcript_82735:684-1334(-)